MDEARSRDDAFGADVLPLGVLVAEVQQQSIFVSAARAVVNMTTFAGKRLPAVADRDHAGDAKTGARRTHGAITTESNSVGLEFLELVGAQFANAPGVGQKIVEKIAMVMANRGPYLIFRDGPRKVDRICLATHNRRGNSDCCDSDIARVVSKVLRDERLKRGGIGNVVDLLVFQHYGAVTSTNASKASVRTADIAGENRHLTHATMATRSSAWSASSYPSGAA